MPRGLIILVKRQDFDTVVLRLSGRVGSVPAPLEPPLAELLIRLVALDAGIYETFHPHFPGDGPPREANLLNHGDETIPEGGDKGARR